MSLQKTALGLGGKAPGNPMISDLKEGPEAQKII